MVAVVALVAGGAAVAATVLGLSMTLLQFSIGALNDVVDAPLDAGRKPGKPIPAGIVTSGMARRVVVIAAAGGLTLASVGGPGLVMLALVGLAIGLWYDLGASGTVLSWLPLALGIPLLPVFGWYGATGALPPIFLVIVPVAAVAGTALAVANASVDVERDTAAGSHSIAVALGSRGASLLAFVLHAAVAIAATSTAALLGAPGGWVVAVAAAAAIPLGAAAAAATRAAVVSRERSWEVQAVGTGLLAVAWLVALSQATQVAAS